MRRRSMASGTCLATAIILMFTALPGIAAAQGTAPPEKPVPAIEVSGGYAAFLDESAIDHGVIGGAFRFHLLPRLSIGPEIVYMIGPGHDRDLLLTGNVIFDFLRRPPGRVRYVTPFVIGGVGVIRVSDRFGSSSFSAYDEIYTAGAGVRGWLTRRVYAASEFRVGWEEAHFRITGTIGVALPD